MPARASDLDQTLRKHGLIVAPCCASDTLMTILHHYAFCPHSRFVRLVLGEIGIEAETHEERPWERRIPFLELNPAGTTPVLVDGQGFAVPGAGVIAEYLDETRAARSATGGSSPPSRPPGSRCGGFSTGSCRSSTTR